MRTPKPIRTIALGLLPLAVVLACTPPDPLLRLQKELDVYPEYSVILEDMRVDGNFTKDYYHQYKVVIGQQLPGRDEIQMRERVLDDERVSKEFYRRHADHLGMVLLSKTQNSDVNTVPQPAQYRYVGDNRYGQWRSNGSGGSFWEFYGKYALLSHVFGSRDRTIGRGEYDSFRTARSAGRTYYGPSKQYGTNGSVTKTTHANFFARQQARQAAARSSFQSKVRSRASSSRSSSSRGGK